MNTLLIVGIVIIVLLFLRKRESFVAGYPTYRDESYHSNLVQNVPENAALSHYNNTNNTDLYHGLKSQPYCYRYSTEPVQVNEPIWSNDNPMFNW